MRRNYAAYSVFYSTFLPPIVGRSLMKKLVADRNTLEQVATNTDKALALLGLENGVERWDTFLRGARATYDPTQGARRYRKHIKVPCPPNILYPENARKIQQK